MNSRNLILGVLSALDWGGPVRVGSVSVRVDKVPRGGTWRDGTVHVETVPTDGFGSGEPCGWPIMTEAEALTEATELIEWFASRWAGREGNSQRIAAARELAVAAAAGRREPRRKHAQTKRN
jgi:hypothetical protein